MVVDVFTLEDIELEISKNINLIVTPEEVYNYWAKKKWKTKKGTLVKTVRTVVNVVNSFKYPSNKRSNRSLSKKDIAKAKEARKNNLHLPSKKETISDNCTARKDRKTRRQPMTSELYAELLKTDEWKAFRQFIFVVKGRICEKCGATEYLQVHHKKYRNGRQPWEYLPIDLSVLCGSCHKKEHGINQ